MHNIFDVILDRDGVLNMDVGYTHKVKDLKIPRHTIEGLHALRNSGARLSIATGQSGIGRGMYGLSEMFKFNAALLDILKTKGIEIAHIAYCPHDPKQRDCQCRKPKTGMLSQLEITLWRIDWPNTWGIGDKPADARMMLNKNANAVLIQSGPANNTTGKSYWAHTDEEVQTLLKDDRVCTAPNLLAAAEIIIAKRAAQ